MVPPALARLLLVAVLGLAPTSCRSDSHSSPTSAKTHAQIEQALRDSPGAPLMLPETLPPHYNFNGPGIDVYSDSGPRQVIGRTAIFTNAGLVDDDAFTYVVEVCTAEAGSDACVVEGDDLTYQREVDGYPVRVRFIDATLPRQSDAEAWERVVLEPYSSSIAWIN